MARQSRLLGRGRLALAGTDAVTFQDGFVYNCAQINLANRHTSGVTVSIYFLRSGETVSDDGTFLESVYVPAGKGDIAFDSQNRILESSGDKLHMVPTVDDVIDFNVTGTQE